MPRRSPSAAGQMTHAELAELLPLLPALTKAMTRRSHEVPAGIRADWRGHGTSSARHPGVVGLVGSVSNLTIGSVWLETEPTGLTAAPWRLKPIDSGIREAQV